MFNTMNNTTETATKSTERPSTALDRETLRARANSLIADGTPIPDLQAILAEHAADPADVSDALASALMRLAMNLDGDSVDAAKVLERERNLRSARATLDREAAEADLRLPPTRDDYSLSSYLAEPRTAKVERIESLQREAHKTLLVAGYKTGKTTLHANLTRSLTEGSSFLGRFAVKPPQGRVGVWNAEMEADDYQGYLSKAGVRKAEQVVIWNLRGYRVPLTSDAAAEAAVEWLRSNEVAYWIIDPWARICSWSGADENVNAEIAPLLQRVDEIANDAGVSEVLVVHHAGHVAGRPRGATVLPDWADGIWLYSRDESDKRYLKAEGRGIGLPEGLVEIDDDGRAIYREVGRKTAKINQLVKDIVEFVAANDGCTTTEVQDSLTASNSLKTDAVRKAIALGAIREERDPDDKRRKLLHFVASSEDSGSLGY
jgi:hypothetical protein